MSLISLIDDESRKRRRKQTLKAREAASEDDIDFEITINEDVSDDDHDQNNSKRDFVDDPLTGGKVKKEKKLKLPKVQQIVGDSSSDGEYELPSWHSNPKELFERRLM
jgi:predicted  nucleic acid-binding Zn-ribbon protein